jgi:intein-encoded DNA endonuclease-like protein
MMPMAGKLWTEFETEYLKEHYVDTPSKEITIKLNRSPKAIRNKAITLGLHAVKRNHSFPKRIRTFSPSSELSYVIGAVMGDGSIIHERNRKRYFIDLRVNDFEFIQQFRDLLSCVLGRGVNIGTLDGSVKFRVQVSDKSLHCFLSKPFDELKPYIEVHPADFLRGFFDSEGSAWIVKRKNAEKKNVSKSGKVLIAERRSVEPVVKFCNTDLELLGYVRGLLIGLGIFPAPKFFKTKGNLGKDPKDCYSFHIYRKDSVKRFMEVVGSSIPRKRLILK